MTPEERIQAILLIEKMASNTRTAKRLIAKEVKGAQK